MSPGNRVAKPNPELSGSQVERLITALIYSAERTYKLRLLPGYRGSGDRPEPGGG
jgi:hypothetical protein